MGHSKGFWISILAQKEIKDLKAMVSLCGRVRNLKYFISNMRIKYLLETKEGFEEYYQDDLKYDYREYIKGIKVPVLLIYGKKDDVVYYTEAFEFKKHYNGKKLEIKILENLDHDLNDVESIYREVSKFLGTISIKRIN